MRQVKILLVDDSAEFLASASDFLARDPRVELVGQARDGLEGVRLASASSNVSCVAAFVRVIIVGIDSSREEGEASTVVARTSDRHRPT